MELNLPSFNFKFSEHSSGRKIFDVIRKKYVMLTPEEWVRQHMIHYLIDFKSFPKGLMAVEKSISVDSLVRRPDIVVYDRNAKPLLIVELKSTDVKISEDTILQVAMYNKKLNVPFLILSNGLSHYCAKFDYQDNRLQFLDEILDYKQLSNKL